MEFPTGLDPIAIGGGSGDESKVLDFLATHQEDLKLDHQAVFTDNFKKHFSSIRKAVVRTFASESDDKTEVQIRIEAGEVSQDDLEHALSTGKNHIRHGKKVYLLTRELKEKASRLQRRISGNQNAPLLATASHRVENFQIPSMDEFLLENDPRFQPQVEKAKSCIT